MNDVGPICLEQSGERTAPRVRADTVYILPPRRLRREVLRGAQIVRRRRRW